MSHLLALVTKTLPLFAALDNDGTYKLTSNIKKAYNFDNVGLAHEAGFDEALALDAVLTTYADYVKLPNGYEVSPFIVVRFSNEIWRDASLAQTYWANKMAASEFDISNCQWVIADKGNGTRRYLQDDKLQKREEADITKADVFATKGQADDAAIDAVKFNFCYSELQVLPVVNHS